MRNAQLDESQAGIKRCRRNDNNFRHVDDNTLVAESEEELKSLLIRVKEESDRTGLKLNVKKKRNKIMASGPSTAWQIEGEKVEVVTDCFFLASKITITDGDCSQRQCVEKQRHYSANKGLCSQGYGLPSGHVRLLELDGKEGRKPKN